MTARRAGLALAAVGLLAAGGLGLSGGPALAGPRAQAQLAPSPAEWWFAGWQVRQRVWPLTQGAGVTVAVIDTGVEASLPDLRGVVLAGADLTGAGGNGETDGDVGNDGHGTAVAALIAGQGYGTGTVGVAPRARILPVKVGDTGARSPSVAAAAIRFAVRHGARVINLSLGAVVASPVSCDPVLQSAVAYALEHDVVVVAASGNANVHAGPVEPGSCAGVLTVGGVEPDGSLWPGSTAEPYVAVAAPGDRVVFVGRDGRYSARASGTSFASALTAGAAALIRSRYPHMPWYEVDQRLTGTALAAGFPVPNDGYGYGIVDLARAVNASAYPMGSPAPDPVYARFLAWLATPGGRAFTARYGSPARSARARPSRAAAVSARVPDPSAGPSSRPRAGVTLQEIVIIAVAAVCVFVAVLVGVLRMSSRRRRPGRHAPWLAAAGAPPPGPVPGNWERRAWSFWPDEDEGRYGEGPGHGRPPGYGPPPLWLEPPDPPGWR